MNQDEAPSEYEDRLIDDMITEYADLLERLSKMPANFTHTEESK